MKAQILLSALLLSISGCASNEGVSPLMESAKNGDLEQVRYLLAKQAKIDAESSYGWTALMFAAGEGHRQIVAELLNHGANPNIVSQKVRSGFDTVPGYPPTTALAEAVNGGHITTAYLLIESGAKIDSRAVAKAGKAGDIGLLEYMKNRGADFNVYTNNSLNPSALCSSIAAGDLTTVRWLCNNGAKINLVLGHSLPLKTAVRSGHPDIVEYLLQQGANPNMPTGDPTYHHSYSLGAAIMDNPHQTAKSDAMIQILRLLLKHGADPTIQDIEGGTMLDSKQRQKANGDAYRKKYPDSEVSSKILERRRISDRHEDLVISILRKHQQTNR